MKFRKEKDTLGEISIPDEKLWGAQTQRSLENFKIAEDLMPFELIREIAFIKEACEKVNADLGILDPLKARYIQAAAKEIREGQWEEHFPLSVWQTGSGTQTNMNVNEVISNRASELKGGKRGDKKFHPNDDVNKSQSSNDVFPSAMRLVTFRLIHENLQVALLKFERVLEKKVKDFSQVIKIGRTHFMDATPISLGQEFSAFLEQIRLNRARLQFNLSHLLFLPIGGTAVGTGINTHPDFSKKVCLEIKKISSFDVKPSENKFEAIATHDSLIQISGTLKTLAVSLMKIASDIRILSSGPRSGIAELNLPVNEPGSSIMPGKVNPTQCEALTMVCFQVISQDLASSLGGASGQMQLNAFKPLIIFNLIRSIRLLGDALNNFREKALEGLEANLKNIQKHLEDSLMLVTIFNPHIGYEKSATIAKAAYERGTTLKEEALRLKILTEEEFDRFMKPEKMIKPNSKI